MEDHAELLNKAFANTERMLIIEGKPATGKTSLMRRLAYEWARGRPEFNNYDLLLYVEFRKIREKNFKSFAELLSSCQELEKGECEVVARFANNKKFCKLHKMLLLLDGYDESSLNKQCEELHNFITADTIDKPLLFDIVLTTRPGFLSMYRKRQGRFIFANVLGFTKWEQKQKYISNHFSKQLNKSKKIDVVHRLLLSNDDLNKLAEIPLFIMFICLVYDKIIDSNNKADFGRTETLLKLYCNIVWYLLDRHQHLFPDRNVAQCFGFHKECVGDKFQVIQDNYLRFPQIHFLGSMALQNIEKNAFSQTDLKLFKLEEIVQLVGLLRKEDKRDANSEERKIEFYFPHRTVQEFLSALTFFVSSGSDEIGKTSNAELPELKTNEFEEFLWLIASSQTIQNVDPAKRTNFFEKYRNPARIQNKLREYYAQIFQKTNIFSLTLTSNITNSWGWVPLSLNQDDLTDFTKDYAGLVNRAFSKSRILVIEGKPGSGKSCLMRRIVYNWAIGMNELKHYDFVFYAEFRKIKEQQFQTIADLVMAFQESFLDEQVYKTLKRLFHESKFFKYNRVLMLLDGYDESSLKLQCEELRMFFSAEELLKTLAFDVILTTRQGYLSQFREQKGRFVFVDVLGFTEQAQKQKYISNHFINHMSDVSYLIALKNLLESNKEIRNLMEIPLMLTFTCQTLLMHEENVEVPLLELCSNIICWLLNRHQKDFPDRDVPFLCGFKNQTTEANKFLAIQNDYMSFPQIQILGKMALQNEKNVFTQSDLDHFKLDFIVEQVGFLRKEQKRDHHNHRTTEFYFLHRIIQDFLAAVHFFYSAEEISLETYKKVISDRFPGKNAKQTMTGLQNFLWRFAAAFDRKLNEVRRLEFFKQHTCVVLDLDIFIMLSSELEMVALNFSMQVCSNVTELHLYSEASKIFTIGTPLNLSAMTKLKYVLCESFTLSKNSDKTIILLPSNIIEMKMTAVKFQTSGQFTGVMNDLSQILRPGSTLELIGVYVQTTEVSLKTENIEQIPILALDSLRTEAGKSQEEKTSKFMIH